MQSNENIINGLKTHDLATIKLIYKNQHPVISAWIRKNNGNQDDANDIIQEALLIILRKVNNEEIALNCSFTTYLFSICKHLWFQEIRKRSRTELMQAMELFEIIDHCNEWELEEKKLRLYVNHISKLGTKCRDILLLCIRKKSVFEIMQIMNLKNPQAVADKKKNCRKRLMENILKCSEYREIMG